MVDAVHVAGRADDRARADHVGTDLTRCLVAERGGCEAILQRRSGEALRALGLHVGQGAAVRNDVAAVTARCLRGRVVAARHRQAGERASNPLPWFIAAALAGYGPACDDELARTPPPLIRQSTPPSRPR